jgi:shikimate kinase
MTGDISKNNDMTLNGHANIVLLGFMGTGKSATGEIVARRLEREFLDMDAVIERRAGKSISRIFREDGEPAFRRMERELVGELALRRNLVIAAGGGVVLNADNIRDLESSGVLICLTASADVILQRLRGDDRRPLLEDGDKAQRIKQILEQRQFLYEALPHHVDTTFLTPEAAADQVIEIFHATVK